MRGKYICPEYRRRWLSELGSFPLDNRIYSRCKNDFEDIYEQVVFGNIQLTLF